MLFPCESRATEAVGAAKAVLAVEKSLRMENVETIRDRMCFDRPESFITKLGTNVHVAAVIDIFRLYTDLHGAAVLTVRDIITIDTIARIFDRITGTPFAVHDVGVLMHHFLHRVPPKVLHFLCTL